MLKAHGTDCSDKFRNCQRQVYYSLTDWLCTKGLLLLAKSNGCFIGVYVHVCKPVHIWNFQLCTHFPNFIISSV